MSEKKQIEEMAKVIKSSLDGLGCGNFHFTGDEISTMFAKSLYDASYRKQNTEEWKRVEVSGRNYGQVYYQHKDCSVNEVQLFQTPHHFCPNCGAKMKDGEGK